ncbi:MAG: rhomboid family intramembrane serine protease [Arcobacter butzleri]|jgi:rhomboid protease GluP|nr:rhomboid family intramembrane serine protease [Arcobacteraceae bacterium]MDY0364849.1 rhomboid family intramembrane serine protease [Arcobacteraceae bacterium]NLO16712.1 rhomboid family intramembrane serine protease [Aliarcobacter butzleri]
MKNSNLTLTNIIIAITILSYFIQNNIEYGIVKMGMNSLFLEYNLWYQPITTIFAHGGVVHLGFNMLVLFQFGNLIERELGKQRLIILYFIGGIATSLLSFLFIYSVGLNHNIVGASGAICVLLGYIALLDRYQRKGLIIWVALISFAPLLIGMPIAWYGHLIGFAIGWLMGYFL